MEKQKLRQTTKDALTTFSARDKAGYDAAIMMRFFDLLSSLPPVETISAYHPMPVEVNCIPIVEALYDRGKHLCFPGRINPDHPQLVFKELSRQEYDACDKSDFFMPGRHHIVTPDLLLIPLIGFHRHGFRLGYGGGYYDQALYELRRQKNVIAIGLGYSLSEIKDHFYESHDEKMDFIVTEKQVLRIS